MKTLGVCGVGGAVAFFVMSLQMGLFRQPGPEAAEPEAAASQPAKPKPPKEPLPYPEGLYPACRGKPVLEAAAFKRGAGPQPLVFLRSNGTVHSWQEHLEEEWDAQTVETTRLIVVLSRQRKIEVGVQTYANGAPPVHRYRYELDAHLVEARTGNVLARKRFVSHPRQVRQLEAWELTALGEPVSFREVFNWVDGFARAESPGAAAPDRARD